MTSISANISSLIHPSILHHFVLFSLAHWQLQVVVFLFSSFWSLFHHLHLPRCLQQQLEGKLGCRNDYKLAGDPTATPRVLPRALIGRIRSAPLPRTVLTPPQNHLMVPRRHHLQQTPKSLRRRHGVETFKWQILISAPWKQTVQM